MSPEQAAARSPTSIPHPTRIGVAGVSGVGKSTLCARIAAALDLPYTELDSLFHGPNWTPLASFEDNVDAILRTDRWVTEVSYFGHGVGDRTLVRAELLVWLDYPMRIGFARLLRRTLSRRLRRAPLWNGNVEPPLWTFFTDDTHILRWGISTRNKWKQRMPRVRAAHPDLEILRFTHPRDTEAWLRTLHP